ncbi:MAG: helix-hairpin-helix domain-containing protein [Planctomycetota bacterium]
MTDLEAESSESLESSKLLRPRPLHSDKRGYDSLPYRLRIVFWREHQNLIAIGVLLAAFAMTLFLFQKYRNGNGLVDIDQTTKLVAEYQIDINLAPAGEWMVLPGIGPKLAEQIVSDRKTNGPFPSHESLTRVSGIGHGKLSQIQPYLADVDSSTIASSNRPMPRR